MAEVCPAEWESPSAPRDAALFPSATELCVAGPTRAATPRACRSLTAGLRQERWGEHRSAAGSVSPARPAMDWPGACWRLLRTMRRPGTSERTSSGWRRPARTGDGCERRRREARCCRRRRDRRQRVEHLRRLGATGQLGRNRALGNGLADLDQVAAFAALHPDRSSGDLLVGDLVLRLAAGTDEFHSTEGPAAIGGEDSAERRQERRSFHNRPSRCSLID